MINFIRDNWLYLLLIGGFIFMMVKGGGCCGGMMQSHGDQTGQGGGCCGGGHSHGDQGGNNSGSPSEYSGYNSSQSNTVKDPICGMNINPDTAIREISNGRAYFFCSESCRREFLSRQQGRDIRSY